MSSIARWTYVTEATVYPFISQDDFSGQTVYGPSYTILCDFIVGGDETRYQNGDQTEFVVKSIFWTEDQRPQYRDEIEIVGVTQGRECIRSTKYYNMAAFGEADSPDFELATG